MPDIVSRLGIEVLVADGGMGTMLQRAGIPAEQCPEQLNITAPDVVLEIHRNYVLAGADCITTNTFGGSRPKLASYGLGEQVVELNREAVRLARTAGAVHVLGDVGPTGLVMEPIGDVSFDEMYGHFAEQVRALAEAEPDAILIETMTDIAEARCALIAARDVCDLPVFVSVTLGENGRTELSGTSPDAAAVILEACGAAAVGLNCGLGPEQMLPLLQDMAEATWLPLFVQPNAGIPRSEGGETVFPGTPEEMGRAAAEFVDTGAVLVGSCCGSTPSFTGAISDAVDGRTPRTGRRRQPGLALASVQKTVRIGDTSRVAIVGERINPTGRVELADSLRTGSMSVVRELAIAQQHDGADLLDVNVGAVDVDEQVVLPSVVRTLSTLSELPLVIDNTDAGAVDAALKVYPGRALLNSVSGGEAALRDLLPVARRWGAAVLILALDDDGIPADVEGRLQVAQAVRSAAHAAGLDDRDLAVDCLTLAAATDPTAAGVTLEAVRAVTEEWGLPTILGVSNVSHGLPGRGPLNAAFFAMAVQAGLSAAIADPSDLSILRSRAAAELIAGKDPEARRWIAWTRAESASSDAIREEEIESRDPRAALAEAIASGDRDGAPSLVEGLVADGSDPADVIAGIMTPAIQELGEAFGRGEVFLPQLMVAADAMKAAVAVAKGHLPDGGANEGTVVFGTVEGDIHSIGKDICVSLLESAGFEVIDLGVDVPAERFVEAAERADAVCLSALMTTTLPSMRATTEALSGAVPVVVGGAVVTDSFARSIGAGYADDAPGCVVAVRDIVGSGADS
jgi:5-methyltetrahydrofolate--homocysteine methyltransferase